MVAVMIYKLNKFVLISYNFIIYKNFIFVIYKESRLVSILNIKRLIS